MCRWDCEWERARNLTSEDEWKRQREMEVLCCECETERFFLSLQKILLSGLWSSNSCPLNGKTIFLFAEQNHMFLITAQKNWLHYLVPRYCNSTMWKKETCSGDLIMKTLKASNCHYGNWFVCSCALPSHKLKISNLEYGRIFLFLWRGNKTFIIWHEGINLIYTPVRLLLWFETMIWCHKGKKSRHAWHLLNKTATNLCQTSSSAPRSKQLCDY